MNRTDIEMLIFYRMRINKQRILTLCVFTSTLLYGFFHKSVRISEFFYNLRLKVKFDMEF
jgi:hypothetical protein